MESINSINSINSMNIINCIKYKNLDINKLKINDFDVKYEDDSFYIQGPIFTDYDIINYKDKKYLELKLNEKKNSHINFLTLIDSIELKLNNFIKRENGNENGTETENRNGNKGTTLKTQVITNIQNKKSLKVKISDNTILYNSNKEQVSNLYSRKISILYKLEFFRFYYSWVAIQILQLD